MPRAPRKCADFTCETRVVGQRYCPAHAVNWQTKGASRTGTTEHKVWRKAVLDRDHWRCQTRGPGCEGRATQADHIIPVAEGGQSTLANGAAICADCHKKKSRAESVRGRA